MSQSNVEADTLDEHSGTLSQSMLSDSSVSDYQLSASMCSDVMHDLLASDLIQALSHELEPPTPEVQAIVVGSSSRRRVDAIHGCTVVCPSAIVIRCVSFMCF
jgi:hypothetical protein